MKATLEHTCKDLLGKHHHNCLFKNILTDGDGLSFTFDNSGILNGRFYCHEKYQGYNNRVHGGIMAAVIDESMVHCLMGHGIVCVTTNLSIQYRMPVYIHQYADIITCISDTFLNDTLFQLKAEIIQNRKVSITANGTFNKMTKQEEY